MIDFKPEIKQAVNEELERVRKARHPFCGSIIVAWLTTGAKLKKLPDLDKKLEKFTRDIYRMCEEMRIEYDRGDYVVKVNGPAEQTFKKLRLGTDWFEPDRDVMTQIMAGLDDQFGNSKK